MVRSRIKISVLTSSRADYGIYLPLLKAIRDDSEFDLEIIVFGMHLSEKFGFSGNEIKDQFPSNVINLKTRIEGDSPSDIVKNYISTMEVFNEFWKDYKSELIFCLGDRYEMNAAIQAAIPYNFLFAHIHGGETTLGAIDNIYRDQITLASTFHFCATQKSAERIHNLVANEDKSIFSVGSLSLESISLFEPIDFKEFADRFLLKGLKPGFILVTVHPETNNWLNNTNHSNEVFEGLKVLSQDFQILITMPNADTTSDLYREKFEELKVLNPEMIFLIENFGKSGYFSAMHYSSFIFGNTSSGIIEAASFNKFVINIGGRQLGRERSENVIDCRFSKSEIIEASRHAFKMGEYNGNNIYYQANPSKTILETIKAKLL